MSDERRRVVFVIGDLRRAGAETQLVRLATGLDRSRYDASIVIVRPRNEFVAELAAAGVPVSSLGRRSALDVHVLWRLFRHLAAARPHIVHSYLPFPNLLTAIAGRWARIPVVLLSQRASYEATLTPFWRRAARWAHRRASHVIVNSQAALREELAAGFPPERISYVPNGVDVPAQAAAPDRAALGLPPGPLVACVAQFAREKGHADMIAAWPRVRAACPGASLALVGDGALRPEIEAEAAKLGVRDSVLFLGFRSPATPFLAAADVVVLPSRTEGMPNALLEAMALGKATVATAVGGVTELLEPTPAAEVVPPAAPAALAQALATLLGDPARRVALGAAARQRVEEHFTTSKMIEATLGVYASLLEPRAQPRQP